MDSNHSVERQRRQVESARDLRQRMTTAEELLWTRLRGRQLGGLKFRRQHPIGPFVVDFCCATHRLVVEVDGGIDDELADQDEERTRLLTANGYHIIRCRNGDVFRDLETILDQIANEARRLAD